MTKIPANRQTNGPPPATPAKIARKDDGTRALLKTGAWIMLIALLCLGATEFLFGGVGALGAHTDSGWLALIFALMGIPFALMLLVLGAAKWLRNRGMAR